MLKLSDIVKNVDLKSRQATNLTYCNAILFFIHCLENNIGEQAYWKYKIARFYKYVQDNKCANNSFVGWSKTIPYLKDNIEEFNEFVKTIDTKKDPNYLDLQQYVKSK